MKTYKHIFAGLLMAAISFSGLNFTLNAETVTQKQASKLAANFFNEANGQVMAAPKLVYNGRNLTTDRLFVPFYVYNFPAGGFVIISAENKAMPILGYSLKENFDPDRMSGSLETLLRSYASDIEQIRYDDRVPYEAISAWNDIPGYIHSLLTAQYDATDILFTPEDIDERISNLQTTGRWEEVSSDIYTPLQWEDIIDEALLKEKNIAIGLVGSNEVFPTVIHGRKGDYYRIGLEKDNDWLMRLSSTEYFGGEQIADLYGLESIEEDMEEDVPFAFYEEFLREVKEEEALKDRQLEERLSPSRPLLKNIGGGRYEIILPENASLARIYNMAGSMVNRLTFHGSPVAGINLEGQPHGFYFILLNGESGQPYGFKVTR